MAMDVSRKTATRRTPAPDQMVDGRRDCCSEANDHVQEVDRTAVMGGRTAAVGHTTKASRAPKAQPTPCRRACRRDIGRTTTVARTAAVAARTSEDRQDGPGEAVPLESAGARRSTAGGRPSVDGCTATARLGEDRRPAVGSHPAPAPTCGRPAVAGYTAPARPGEGLRVEAAWPGAPAAADALAEHAPHLDHISIADQEVGGTYGGPRLAGHSRPNPERPWQQRPRSQP